MLLRFDSCHLRIIKTLSISALIWLSILSCSQSPIFFEVSNEVEPKEPLIKGAPSAIVEFKSGIYVARKFLYTYVPDETGKMKWQNIIKNAF